MQNTATIKREHQGGVAVMRQIYYACASWLDDNRYSMGGSSGGGYLKGNSPGYPNSPDTSDSDLRSRPVVGV